MDIVLENIPSPYQPPRHVRIAALAFIHHNAEDQEDFELLADALDLTDLLQERATA